MRPSVRICIVPAIIIEVPMWSREQHPAWKLERGRVCTIGQLCHTSCGFRRMWASRDAGCLCPKWVRSCLLKDAVLIFHTIDGAVDVCTGTQFR